MPSKAVRKPKTRDTREARNRKLTRKDVQKAAAKRYKNWGRWGKDDEIGTLNFTTRRGHRRRGEARAQGQGDSRSRSTSTQHGPQGGKSKYPALGRFNPDPPDDAHRDRCVLGRARSPQDPRHRRPRHHAAPVRHAVGRPRPHPLRRLHVERLRLPQRDHRRRAEGRYREDARRRWSAAACCSTSRALRQEAGCPTASRSPTRCSTTTEAKQERDGAARRLSARPHRPRRALPHQQELGRLLGRRCAGLRVRDARLAAARAGGGVATDTWGAEVRPNETEDTNQPWHWIAIPIMGLHGRRDLRSRLRSRRTARPTGVYEFLFVAPALPITGAVGSPVNPLAIK